MVFDHWEQVPCDPLDPTSEAGQLVTEVRKRKKLTDLNVPELSNYLDKL